ncbi:MAG TPA: S8 family peptidase [Candidatus Pullilachnospira intestinigallinarum]|nr:S8 family peptidase [Candidatus Pullilachnospira intestinigallinarum]
MSALQDIIYSNDYADLIIPFRNLTRETFLEMYAQFHPQIINEDYAVLHALLPSGSAIGPDGFLYSIVPKLFTTLDTTSLEAAGILRTQTQPALQLEGSGVLMGFLDTGILYSHPAFLAPGNNTRIIRIWDQTIPSPDGSGPYGYGTEYTEETINQALRLPDPASLVPTDDPTGHGTSVAGIAAGSSDPESGFTGAAPKSRIAMVRLKEAKQNLKKFYLISGEGPVYQENDLMTGVQYLVDLARRLSMPLVICIALGTNQGDHMGFTPLDLSLARLEALPGIAVSVAAGNEAGKAHHYFGSVPAGSDAFLTVEVLVKERTPGFALELWGHPPELFSIGLRSPVGETVPRIPARLGQTETVQFVLENTRAYVNYELVQNTSGSQLIFLRLENPTQGIWNVNVYCADRISGEFHMWLPITGLSQPDVTFLAPDPYTTVTVPAAGTQVITSGAYSAYTDSLYLHSSRGFTRDMRIKPDIAAPGVEVTAPSPRGYTAFTGTSAAAALTAGSAALLMEWSMRRGNSLRYFTGYEVKNFLIRGASRSRALTYPNREWGYGSLDLYQSFLSVT